MGPLVLVGDRGFPCHRLSRVLGLVVVAENGFDLVLFCFFFFFFFFLLLLLLLWGQRDLETSVHFISSPRPTPRRKKCSRTNEGNPDCQNILPRMTLSSANQNHRRGRPHVARGSPLEDPKGDSKSNRPTIGAW